MVTIQEVITNIQQSSVSNYEALEQSLSAALTVIRKDIEPINSTLTEQVLQAQTAKNNEGHVVRNEGLDEQIHRMEQLQLSIEGLVTGQHCHGCTCRSGYDSSQASPLKHRQPPSNYGGSDATGASPHPHGHQAFDMGSIRYKGRRDSVGSPVKPYTIDLGEGEGPEGVVVHPPGAKEDTQNV